MNEVKVEASTEQLVGRFQVVKPGPVGGSQTMLLDTATAQHGTA